MISFTEHTIKPNKTTGENREIFKTKSQPDGRVFRPAYKYLHSANRTTHEGIDENDADVEEQQASKNRRRIDGTPLIFAVKNGAADIVKRLIDADAKLNLTDELGRTALHYAAFNGRAEIVEALESSSKLCRGLMVWSAAKVKFQGTVKTYRTLNYAD